jgi:hypothetical protein
MILENSVFWLTSDALRILTPVANVVVRNNTIRGGFETRSGDAPGLGSVRAYNNIFFPQDYNAVPTFTLNPFACYFPNCAEFAETNNNLWFDNESGAGAMIMQPRGGPALTLAQLQSLGLEQDSRVFHLNSLASHFQDPRVVLGPGTGGDDYRLKTGSAAINAGDDVNCAHANMRVGTCDIGAYEFGSRVPTGPIPIHSEVITFTESGSPVPSEPGNFRIVP